ncbi:50S ribosomal L18 [Chlorella sorokiniana]|uniref:50S ribosomal L18 n=1 Tax=Chlorella sorokiniana TaxID=3076 RepID=A0A2P6TZ84_CHLSO|nr:50S ribosomal L18 [Chlorella sorokiniana]|eukprot:PRW59382.1 50S ribosomal L18 [Chlorella sorokiniana]
MGGLPVPKPFHLKMFFSNKNVVAQIVRMADGHIVAAASTHEAVAKEALKAAGTSTSCKEAARAIGESLAQRAKDAGLEGVHWRRRHGESYSGKRKELIEALRAAGMPLV